MALSERMYSNQYEGCINVAASNEKKLRFLLNYSPSTPVALTNAAYASVVLGF